MTPTRGDLIRAALSAAVSGVILGLAARLVMRFVALESGMRGGFSIGGSLEVIVFGALVGAPIALVFFLLRPRLRVRAPWAGLIAGFAVFAVMALLPPEAARSALDGTPDTPGATALAFAILFLAWGVLLEFQAARLARARG